MTRLTLLLAALAVPGSAALGQWQQLQSGTRASLRGLSVVDSRTAWASGARGTVIHSTDGGSLWTVDTIPGASSFDLRGIHARSARVAHVAATAGRIWRTTDGGDTWTLRYQAADTSTFLDAIEFWDDRRGIALGDPIGGRFVMVITEDGGETWHDAPIDQRPVALEGEAAFAASGSSIVLTGMRDIWLGSGGLAARLHHSGDGGRTWRVLAAPHPQGPSAGTFALAWTPERVLSVGGDYQLADSSRMTAGVYGITNGEPTAAQVIATGGPRGFRSGVAAARTRAGWTVLAVGPSGSDISVDAGVTWSAFDQVGFHAVRAAADGTFYASGSDGRVAVYHASRR